MGCSGAGEALVAAPGNFKICKVPIAPAGILKIGCATYAYTSTANTGYPNDSAALDDCTTCGSNQNKLVNAVGDSVGYCQN